MIWYLIAGLIGVSNMILWGIYGDLLVEEFSPGKILRSLTLAAFWSVVLFVTNPLAPLFIVALATIALERITTEIYKALIRQENQEKYLIPSDLNLKGSRWSKASAGVTILLLLLILVHNLQFDIGKPYLVALVGFGIALGGMLKDAPYEGFDFIKFFRSPVVAVAVGVILTILHPEVPALFFLLAIAGGERVVSEFYKKIYGGRVPGKFKSKKHDQNWLVQRKKVLLLYAINIVLLIALNSVQ